MAGLAGSSEPASDRRLRQWVPRLVEADLLERIRIRMREDSIVWVVRRWSGVRPPTLLGQMTRHELAVTAVPAGIGRSGSRWTHQGTVEALADGESREAPETAEWLFSEIAPGIVLVNFRLHTPERDIRVDDPRGGIRPTFSARLGR